MTNILRKGMELCSTSKKKFIDEMEVVFQRQILSSPASPAHWTLPRKGRNNAELTTGKITGQNEMIWHMVHQSNMMIATALPENHPVQQTLTGAILPDCYEVTY
jgi:hypothetical protein